MNGKRRIVTLSVLLGTLLLSLALASSSPASPISSKKAQLRLVQARLQTVYHKVDMAVEKYNQATTQLSGIKLQISENEKQLKVAEYNLAIADRQLSARARDIYKTHDVGVTDVLFAASSFDELVTQLDMMERLGNSDVDTVQSIKSYRAEIKDRRVKLDADKKAAAKLVTEAAAQKAEVEGLQNRLESMTAGIKADIKRMEAAQAAAAQRAAAAAAAANGGSTGGGTSNSGNVVDPGGSGHSAVVGIAQAELGKPYVYGAAGPNSFDCSGLTMYVYAEVGVNLYHGATMQQRESSAIPLSELQPGDLIFFGNASFSHHVAIFVSGSTCIEAPHTGDVVRYGTWTGRDAWIGGRY